MSWYKEVRTQSESEFELQLQQRNGNTDVIKLLLQDRTIASLPEGFYGCALNLTTKAGHEEVARLLRERKANLIPRATVIPRVGRIRSTNGWRRSRQNRREFLIEVMVSSLRLLSKTETKTEITIALGRTKTVREDLPIAAKVDALLLDHQSSLTISDM